MGEENRTKSPSPNNGGHHRIETGLNLWDNPSTKINNYQLIDYDKSNTLEEFEENDTQQIGDYDHADIINLAQIQFDQSKSRNSVSIKDAQTISTELGRKSSLTASVIYPGSNHSVDGDDGHSLNIEDADSEQFDEIIKNTKKNNSDLVF